MAGHIDHGKSALVTALTGKAMDRLDEERRRGITIDLNFAPLTVGSVQAGVVDVPGHEDFVRTMVAGASGVDLALLVIAADEGIMPQTLEHLAVLEHLGVPAGIAVLTKADLVSPEQVGLLSRGSRRPIVPLVGGVRSTHRGVRPNGRGDRGAAVDDRDPGQNDSSAPLGGLVSPSR